MLNHLVQPHKEHKDTNLNYVEGSSCVSAADGKPTCVLIRELFSNHICNSTNFFAHACVRIALCYIDERVRGCICRPCVHTYAWLYVHMCPSEYLCLCACRCTTNKIIRKPLAAPCECVCAGLSLRYYAFVDVT